MPGTIAPDLVRAFAGQVSSRAAEPAMYFRNGDGFEAIDWASFGAGARRFSSYLLTEGVAEQDHIAIWAGNRPEWHVADMGTLALRCRPVPVYQTLSAEQAQYVLGHSESRVVVVETEELAEQVLTHRAELPDLRRIVVMGGLTQPSADGLVMSWSDALQRGENALDANAMALDARAAAVDREDIATLIYTSGTTGPPKAVLLTHANIMATTAALSTVMDASSDDRVLSYLPLAHIAERQVSEFRSYIYGNPVWFLDGVPNLGERLREVRPTVFFAVPRVWEKMSQTIHNGVAALPVHRRIIAKLALRIGKSVATRREQGKKIGAVRGWLYRKADALALSKLREQTGLDKARIAATGAAPISAAVLRHFASFGVEICEVYGQTEDTGVTTINRPGAVRFGTVGTTLPGIEVKLAEDGEILVRGENVFRGYYKDDAATAEVLVDGWLQTGDVGEVDAAGYLRITDRKKDLIITAGGKNISPSNIESLLKGHELVGNAVAIGDQRPYMTAVLTLDPDEARRWAAGHGVEGDLGAVSRSSLVRVAIEAHVKDVNRHLSHVEQIKRWTLLEKDFAMGDELTPTLKVKRKVVAEKYAVAIDAMYAGRGVE